MGKCLLCDQLFLEKETFLGIISIQKRQNNVCPDCLGAFEKIGDKHCPTCYRNGCETQCKDCQKWEKEGHSVKHQAIFTYNAAMKKFFSKYKFQGDVALGAIFSRDLKKKIKPYKNYSIVPVPLSKERMAECKFNQVTALLDASGVAYEEILSKKNIAKQSDKNRKERLESQCPFQVIPGSNISKNILIIDDIYTTGATLKGIYQLLYENGAQNVKSLTIAR
ncbi:ComF family protein [Streptococcus equinus]|uniref:ComF family protein n=1 Tax=Streptococcus equinus TaxID=1335 RepID=UPI003B5C0CC6